MAPRQRLLRALLAGALFYALVAGTVRLSPPVPGEPLPRRWARKLVEHPVRSTVALACLAAACFRRTSTGRLKDRDRLEGPLG